MNRVDVADDGSDAMKKSTSTSSGSRAATVEATVLYASCWQLGQRR